MKPKRAKSKTSPKAAPVARRASPEQRATVADLASKGFGPVAIAAEVTKRWGLSPPMSHKTVARILAGSRAPAATSVTGDVDPELAGQPLEDLLRLETVKLLAAGRRFAAAGNASAYLRTMSTLPSLIALGDRLAARRGPNERVFDGLADVLTRGLAKDAERRRSNPADWLADAGHRLRVDMAECVEAIARLDLSAPKAADLCRPLVLGAEAILAAVAGQAAVMGAR